MASQPEHRSHAVSLLTLSRRVALAAVVLLVMQVAAFGAPARPGSAPTAAPKAGTIRTPAPSASPATPTDYNIRVTAQTLRYDDQKHFLTLDGNVVFTHLDTQITSPHAEFYTDKQIGYFTKGVRITQPGTTITSDKVSAFYAERKAVLTGRVEVVTEKVKGAADNKPAAKSTTTPTPAMGANAPASTLPTILLCNELDYWWEKQEGDAIGDVKVRQGDKRGFSDRAHYIGQDTRTVHMYSNVRYERGPNDWMTCEDAVIDMNTNVFTGNGNVEAFVKLQGNPPANGPLTNPHGDRVMKPLPPVVPDARRAPDGLPSPSDINAPPESTQPPAPEQPAGESDGVH